MINSTVMIATKFLTSISMIYKRVIYTIKKNSINQIKKAIITFIGNVKKNEPKTKIYEAYMLDDGVTIIHYMAFTDRNAEAKHRKAPYTKQFVDILYPLCRKKQIFNTLYLIHSNT